MKINNVSIVPNDNGIALASAYHVSKLEKEYSILKALNSITNKVIRFNDFDHLNFVYDKERGSIALRCPRLKLFQLVQQSQMEGVQLSPDLVVDFLLVNGSTGKFKNGGNVPHPLLPVAKKSDKVWKQQGPLGFWKLVEASEMEG